MNVKRAMVDVNTNVLTQSTVSIALVTMDTDWHLTTKIVKVYFFVTSGLVVCICFGALQ